MSQHIRSGGAFVATWRPLQPDQTLEALEGDFDAPAQAIERKDIGSGELLFGERGDEDHPIGGVKRALRDLMPALACGGARLASGLLGGLRRLLERDQTQAKRRARSAGDCNGYVDQLGFPGV